MCSWVVCYVCKNVFVLVCPGVVDKEGREGTRTKQKKAPLWILISLHRCFLQLSPCPVGILSCSGHSIFFSGYFLRFTLSSSPNKLQGPPHLFIFLSFSLSSFKTKNNQMGVFTWPTTLTNYSVSLRCFVSISSRCFYFFHFYFAQVKSILVLS